MTTSSSPTPAARPLHVSLQPMRWGDMDAMGHVNNTIYFRYAEQARVEWLDLHQIPCGPQFESTPVLVNASCDFIVPLTYPGMVEITTYCDEIGRSSFMTRFEIRIQGQDLLYAQGKAKVVWISPKTGRSVELPPTLRALLEATR